MNLTLHLNARFQPKDRFALEDALQEILETNDAGEVTGGGSLMMENGEIESCDIELDLDEDQKDPAWLAGLLNSMGIPKGSSIQGIEPPIGVGTLEGLAIYLNGTDLPKEVYQSCDVNYVIDQLEQAMDGIGSMYSYRELDTVTALYFYGVSFALMQEKIAPFVASYPLCQKSRIEQIA